jgi:hypothetical protein
MRGGVLSRELILGQGYGSLYGSVPKDCNFFKITQNDLILRYLLKYEIIEISVDKILDYSGGDV